MTVLVYDDYIHNNGALTRALRVHFGENEVRLCDAGDILAGVLNDRIRLLVMPGGADLFYAEKLNGAGNAKIRAWTESGGAYLGICAGAYYACDSIAWAQGTKQEISGSRELKFFNGQAIGPIAEFIQDSDVEKSWQDAVIVSYDDGLKKITTKIHYEAGPFFTGGSGHKILARYDGLSNKPAAIIECVVGKGRAVLCGPHPENNADLLARQNYRNQNPFHARTSQVANNMKSADLSLWAALLEHCVR